MTVEILMEEYLTRNPGGHFFDTKTLKFFGERVSEMRVLKGVTVISDRNGKQHLCYTLSTLQRKNPAGPKRHYAFFDVETFEVIA